MFPALLPAGPCCNCLITLDKAYPFLSNVSRILGLRYIDIVCTLTRADANH